MQLRAKRQRSQDLLKLLQQRTLTEQINKQLKKVTSAATQLAELQQKRAELPEVTPAKLRRLEELSSAIRDLEAQVQALGLAIELTPDRNAEVIVTEAGKSRHEAIRKQQTKVLRSPQTLNLQLSGWGRALVRSGAKEAQELTAELAETKDALRKALLDGQVATVDAARDFVAMQKDVDAQVKVAQTALTAQLSDYESAEELQKARTSATNRVAALEEGLQAMCNVVSKIKLAKILSIF